jgi:hypothetical protein
MSFADFLRFHWDEADGDNVDPFAPVAEAVGDNNNVVQQADNNNNNNNDNVEAAPGAEVDGGGAAAIGAGAGLAEPAAQNNEVNNNNNLPRPANNVVDFNDDDFDPLLQEDELDQLELVIFLFALCQHAKGNYYCCVKMERVRSFFI